MSLKDFVLALGPPNSYFYAQRHNIVLALYLSKTPTCFFSISAWIYVTAAAGLAAVWMMAAAAAGIAVGGSPVFWLTESALDSLTSETGQDAQFN